MLSGEVLQAQPPLLRAIELIHHPKYEATQEPLVHDRSPDANVLTPDHTLSTNLMMRPL